MLSFVERLKLKTSDLVMTYRARTAEGRDFFAYILCNEEQVKAMKKDYAEQRSAAPSSYGKVLYHDFLVDPDEKAKEFLKNWLEENGGELL